MRSAEERHPFKLAEFVLTIAVIFLIFAYLKANNTVGGQVALYESERLTIREAEKRDR